MRLLFAIFLLAASLHGEEFKAKISLSDKEMTIDEQLSIVVHFEHPPNYTPDIQTMRANLLQHMGLSEPPFVLISSDSTQNKATFILEPQIRGKHAITFREIPFIPEDGGEPVEIISDIFEVKVTIPPWNREYEGLIAPLISLTDRYPLELDLANRKRVHQIRMERAQFPFKPFPWVYLGGIFLFALLYLIARQQPKLEVEWKESLTLVKKRALKKIQLLAPEKKSLEVFYTALTDTVRNYIEERFQVHAPKQTTQEFLEAMSTHPGFDRKTQKMLSHFLTSSDKVKFAEHEPTLAERHQARRTAEYFIQQS